MLRSGLFRWWHLILGQLVYVLSSLVIYESDLNCLYLCVDFGFSLRFTVGNCVSVWWETNWEMTTELNGWIIILGLPMLTIFCYSGFAVLTRMNLILKQSRPCWDFRVIGMLHMLTSSQIFVNMVMLVKSGK